MGYRVENPSAGVASLQGNERSGYFHWPGEEALLAPRPLREAGSYCFCNRGCPAL